jgi:molybdate transport system substrate-binding protein
VFAAPFDPVQLADTNLRQLALADPTRSSAGRYSRLWLEQAGLWDTLSSRIRPAPDIAAALAATEQGQAQAAIVYRTEVMGSPRFRTLYTIPGDQGILIPYSAAVLARRPSEEDARIFADYLTSPVARQIFEVMGFIVPRVAPP